MLVYAGVLTMMLAIMFWVSLRRHWTPFPPKQLDVQIASTRLEPFETALPDRLRTALGEEEIRATLAHIFDFRHADRVQAGGGRSGNLEAFWGLPGRVLDMAFMNKDNVRGILAELSTICNCAEHTLPDATAI